MEAAKECKVALCAIVKDEAHIIRRMLDSVAPLISSCYILDTGSSDGTMDVCTQWMHENGVGGRVVRGTWKEFGRSRTEALELCRGQCDYALMMDADDFLVWYDAEEEEGKEGKEDGNGEKGKNGDRKVRHGLRPWGDAKPIPPGTDAVPADAPGCEIYYASFRRSDRSSVFTRPLLVNPNLDWKWKGARHEGLYPGRGRSVRHGPVVRHLEMRTRQDGARSRDPDEIKYAKDADAMMAEMERRRVPRDTFYLAQSFRDSGKWRQAVELYMARAAMPFGYAQERYMSYLYAGQLLRKHGGPYACESISRFLQLAHEMDPTRPDAAFELGEQMMAEGNPAAAVLWYKATFGARWMCDEEGCLRDGWQRPLFDGSAAILECIGRKLGDAAVAARDERMAKTAIRALVNASEEENRRHGNALLVRAKAIWSNPVVPARNA